ncbi:MAG: hypothetical protein HYX60_02285 [Legionella longbeachae]|nr:hypothetical protein [Legionella longbeachae]
MRFISLQRIIEALSVIPHEVLIDGLYTSKLLTTCIPIIHGDLIIIGRRTTRK